MSNHLFDAIRRSIVADDAAFIETSEARRWSYGDMVRWSGRIAGAIDTLGIRPGDRVAVQVEKSAEALMLYLACVRCSAVYLPLNTAYTLAELWIRGVTSEPFGLHAMLLERAREAPGA